MTKRTGGDFVDKVGDVIFSPPVEKAVETGCPIAIAMYLGLVVAMVFLGWRIIVELMGNPPLVAYIVATLVSVAFASLLYAKLTGRGKQ